MKYIGSKTVPHLVVATIFIAETQTCSADWICHCSVEMLCPKQLHWSGALGRHIKTQSGCHQCKIRTCTCYFFKHLSGLYIWSTFSSEYFAAKITMRLHYMKPCFGWWVFIFYGCDHELYFFAGYSWQRIQVDVHLHCGSVQKANWDEYQRNISIQDGLTIGVAGLYNNVLI